VVEPDVLPRNANPKKSTIRKVMFSNYGDRMACINFEGSFFMCNFDLDPSSREEPFFSTSKDKGFRFSDFQFVDRDTIIAGLSLKDKQVRLYDT